MLRRKSSTVLDRIFWQIISVRIWETTLQCLRQRNVTGRRWTSMMTPTIETSDLRRPSTGHSSATIYHICRTHSTTWVTPNLWIGPETPWLPMLIREDWRTRLWSGATRVSPQSGGLRTCGPGRRYSTSRISPPNNQARTILGPDPLLSSSGQLFRIVCEVLI